MAARYTYAQLERLWIDAGGPRSAAPVAAAVAEAESGGNPAARNPSGASGLWQILGVPFAGDPFDARVNARMAVAKYRAAGNTFTPWVTYTSGAYRRFLNTRTTPAGSGSGATLAAAAPGQCLIGFSEGGIGGFGAANLCFFSKANARALIGGLLMAGGGAVLVTGVAVLVAHALRNTSTGRYAAEVAGAGLAGGAEGAAAARALTAPAQGAHARRPPPRPGGGRHRGP